MTRRTRLMLTVTACCCSVIAVLLLGVQGGGLGVLLAMLAAYALLGVSARSVPSKHLSSR